MFSISTGKTPQQFSKVQFQRFTHKTKFLSAYKLTWKVNGITYHSRRVAMPTNFPKQYLVIIFIYSRGMAEELKKQGLFVDESYVLRVLEPNIAKDTQDLKEENEVFLESNVWLYRWITFAITSPLFFQSSLTFAKLFKTSPIISRVSQAKLTNRKCSQ